MKLKKLLSILLSVLLLLSFAACGKTEMPKDYNEKVSDNTANIPPENQEEIVTRPLEIETTVEKIEYLGAYARYVKDEDAVFQKDGESVLLITSREQLSPHLEYSDDLLAYYADYYFKNTEWKYGPESLYKAKQANSLLYCCDSDTFFENNVVLAIKVLLTHSVCEERVTDVNLVTDANGSKICVEISRSFVSQTRPAEYGEAQYECYYVAVPNNLGVDYENDVEIIVNDEVLFKLKGQNCYY
jgi:uncharacterized lipoprotein YehR (DUF1307 family)